MKASELKKGVKVKWLESFFAKHWTHGTFLCFGNSTRKAWVRNKKGQDRFVNTRDLLKPHQNFAKEFAKRMAKKRQHNRLAASEGAGMTKIEYLQMQCEILELLRKNTAGCPTGGIYDQLNRRYALEHEAHTLALLKARDEENK